MEANEFLTIVDSTPLVSIDLIIKNNADEILLGKRVNSPAKGYWFVPGGIVKKNECLDRAFERISQREIGIRLCRLSSRFLGVYEHLYSDNFLDVDAVSTHYVVLAYETCLLNGSQIQLDEQHSQVKWWPVSGLLNDFQVHTNTKAYF